jgi:hypothetical protein
MGEHNPVAGYLAFCAIKAVGYTAAGAVISRVYEREDRNALVVGATRTLIGMAVGAAIYAYQHIEATYGVNIFDSMAKAIAGLAVLRLMEWWLLLLLFYDRRISSRRGWCVVCGGTVWSFVLDVPAVLGYIVAAGVWIC